MSTTVSLQARVVMAEQDVERLRRFAGRNPWAREALFKAEQRLGRLRLQLKDEQC